MAALGAAIFTGHARTQLIRRGLSERDVRLVLAAPERVDVVRPGRVVAQKIIQLGSPRREYLVRVFVDVDRVPPQVVTAYRTSKLAKHGGRG